jgi:hypothetical protein
VGDARQAIFRARGFGFGVLQQRLYA